MIYISTVSITLHQSSSDSSLMLQFKCLQSDTTVLFNHQTFSVTMYNTCIVVNELLTR